MTNYNVRFPALLKYPLGSKCTCIEYLSRLYKKLSVRKTNGHLTLPKDFVDDGFHKKRWKLLARPEGLTVARLLVVTFMSVKFYEYQYRGVFLSILPGAV